MNDDLLQRAASSVRERYDGESRQAARTEARVLAAFRGPARRRSRLSLLAIPLVAALLASAAWGTVAKDLRTWLQSTSRERRAASVPQPSKSLAPNPGISAQRTSAPLRDRALPPAPLPLAPLPPAPSARPSQHSPVLPKASPVQPPAAVPSESEIDALYRAAHHAQFAGADPARALLLWDRYLTAAPNGGLSPEARYNRAIALVRLGRKAEAATALEPFARGEYGGYRRAEAASLLEVLRAQDSP
jgi:hypothetical protein